MARAKARAVVVLVVACAATLAAAVPHLDGPVSRVAKYDADSGDPVWDNRGSPPTDGAALRRAGVILPGDATYYVDVADGPPGLAHDVVGAASLFFPPAIRVANPKDAGWVLNYRVRPLVPAGVRAVRAFRLGDGIYLVRVRPA